MLDEYNSNITEGMTWEKRYAYNEGKMMQKSFNEIGNRIMAWLGLLFLSTSVGGIHAFVRVLVTAHWVHEGADVIGMVVVSHRIMEVLFVVGRGLTG